MRICEYKLQNFLTTVQYFNGSLESTAFAYRQVNNGCLS